MQHSVGTGTRKRRSEMPGEVWMSVSGVDKSTGPGGESCHPTVDCVGRDSAMWAAAAFLTTPCLIVPARPSARDGQECSAGLGASPPDNKYCRAR